MIIRTKKEIIKYTLLDTDVNIVDIYALFITLNNTEYQITTCYTGCDDTYSIHVYKGDTEICSANMDSCGGGFGDEILTTDYPELDEFIMDKLFGKQGRIIPF